MSEVFVFPNAEAQTSLTGPGCDKFFACEKFSCQLLA